MSQDHLEKIPGPGIVIINIRKFYSDQNDETRLWIEADYSCCRSGTYDYRLLAPLSKVQEIHDQLIKIRKTKAETK
jgi:hypothetical protein